MSSFSTSNFRLNYGSMLSWIQQQKKEKTRPGPGAQNKFAKGRTLSPPPETISDKETTN